jgi:hypothetical protein
MIAGLSKAVILYLTPLLALTAILLSIFAFLSPAVMLHDSVALLTVTPLPKAGSSQGPDGPSIFFGVLGTITVCLSMSCAINSFVLYRLLLPSQ